MDPEKALKDFIERVHQYEVGSVRLLCSDFRGLCENGLCAVSCM